MDKRMVEDIMPTILAVDDNKDDLTFISSLLDVLIPGCAVTTARSGAEGMETAISESPDVILLDLMMPEMNGLEVCRRLKSAEKTRHIPVIMVTALKNDCASRVESLEIGADAFLSKPIDQCELVSQVKVALRIKKAEDLLRKEKDRLKEIVRERTADLQRANRALRGEKEKFQTLVEKSPFGLSIIGKDGHYRYINPGFTEIFGYGLEEIATGKKWFRKAFPDKEYRRWVTSTWIDDMKASRPGVTRRRIYPAACKDGSRKEIQFIPVMLETGDHFVIYKDITHEKKIEARLVQAQKMEAVGRLAGGLAHDFNNLLTSIMGHADLALMRLAEDDPVKKNLAGIKKGGNRAASLTRQLLAFSRKQDLRPAVLDCNDLIKGFVIILECLIDEEVKLETVLASGLRRVKADRGQMEQVVMNLVINAGDAMPEGGKLTIETANVDLEEKDDGEKDTEFQAGPYVMLRVSDTGMGMDEKTQSLIFEPFFTTKEEGKGTGLGLSTVYGIVKQSEGHISIYSEPGNGTTFKIFFPAMEKAVEQYASVVSPPLDPAPA
ncbi:MAG TPA: response regulator [Desulfobacteria bacterium]|nr:response regulator [Desulfobacteria bacterium]